MPLLGLPMTSLTLMTLAPIHMAQILKLSGWQRKQVALLYHFASLDYLQGLLARLNDLLDFVDATLDKAKTQQRDRLLTDTRWGNRNTSQNWGNHAWQFLADFQRSVVEDIAKRDSDIYNFTDANNCARGLAEYSMGWTTAEEEAEFDAKFTAITDYASNIDETMKKSHPQTSWDDFSLSRAWQEHPLTPLPQMQVRPDIRVRSGDIPPITGVYISLDDPNASPQFAWTGPPGGRLLDAATFTALGLSALNEVGRDGLWHDAEKIFKFLQSRKDDPEIRDHWAFKEVLGNISLAPSCLARLSFQYVPTTWALVEIIPGRFEATIDDGKDLPMGIRVPAGEICPQDGFYFTPALMGSRRHFLKGDVMPEVDSPYGTTIWQSCN
jgi:hypothetical protein